MIHLEALETRTVLSAVTVSFDATTSALAITGDSFNDNFTITENAAGTVTVTPGANVFVPGLGIVAGSSINGIAAPVGYHTGNAVSSISVTLPGGNNFDFVQLLGPGQTVPTTVSNVTIAATGGVHLNFAAKDVANSGNFILTDTSSSTTSAALTATVESCSFATLTVSQTGSLGASVELGNDSIPGRVSVSEGNGNGNSITLDNGNTFGPTMLFQGGGGPVGSVSNSDTISVNGGRYNSLAAKQLLNGTNNTIAVSNITVAAFGSLNSNSPGVTTVQGDGALDQTTVTGVTTYGTGTPIPVVLPPGIGLANLSVTQGKGSVGLVVNPNGAVNDRAAVKQSSVPGFISIGQSDLASNSPMYNTALISGDTAGRALAIVQGDAGGTVLQAGGFTPGDQASILGSSAGGNASIAQGAGIADSASISNNASIGGDASIAQNDQASNPGDTAQIESNTVTGRDSIRQGGANGDTVIIGPGSAGSVVIAQLDGNDDTATVHLTAVGASVSVSQGGGVTDSATVEVDTVGGSVAINQGDGESDGAAVGPGTVGGNVSITQLGGGDDSATITGLTATGGTDTAPIAISIGQGGGDGDMATIAGLTATGGTDTVPIVISIGQGGGSGDTSAMTAVNAPYGNISITQGDVGTSTVGDTASVLNVTIGTGAIGINVNGGVTVVQGSAPGDVTLVQGGSSNNIAITQGDNVQIPDGGSVASDVAEINGTNVTANITIAQGTGTSTLDNAGYYVTAIGFDYLGLINGDAASSPVTAGFETAINQNYANNQLFLGDPSNGSSFVTTFLDAYTGNGGGAFIQAANTTVYFGPLTGTFTIMGVSPGSSYLDAGGNSGVLVTMTDAADTTAVAGDSIPPASPVIISPSTAISISTSTATITGTAEAGSLVQIYSGTTVVGTQELDPGSTSFSIVVPLIEGVPNNLLVTSTDAAGNQSASAAIPTITEIPGNPIVLTPASATSVDAGAATITGTAQANSLVKIYKDFNGNGVIDTADLVVGSLQLTGGAISYSITLPLDQNTANHFLVTATDAAMNQSGAAVVPTITEDSTSPPIPRLTYPIRPVSVNTSQVVITGVALANGLVQIRADLNGNGAIDPGEPVVASEQLTGGATTFSIATPLTLNADNFFLVTTTNAAGTQSPSMIVATVTQDSIAPTEPVVSTPAALSINAANYTITGKAEAGSLVQVYSGDTVVGTEQLNPGQTSYSIAVPLIQNAANHFTVSDTDAAGNQSLTSVVPTVTEDSIAPNAPTVSAPSAPGTVNAATLPITGTAEAGSLVQVYSGDTVVGTEQLNPGQTSYSIAVPLIQNAANHFTVSDTDAAGNQSLTSVVPTVTEDSIAPNAPTVSAPSAPGTVNAATLPITGTAEAGSLVQVYSGDTVVGTEQLNPGQTSYSIAVPLIQNAVNLFTVTASDAAGNQSSPASVPRVTEDSIAPGVPAVSAPLAARTVNVASYTITGTAEAGSLVQIYSGKTVVGTLQLNPGQTSYSITVPLIQNVANHFLVTASDAAGNQSPPVMVPTITTAGMVRGTIYHDLNANGLLDAGEPGLAGRVVFLDLKNDGTLDAGDPTSTTDPSGNFSFPGYVVGSATVFEATTQDASNRYVVDQTTINLDGSVSIGVVPFSPVAPVPVVPSPFIASPNPDANTAYIQSLYRAVLGRIGGDSEVAGWLGAMNSGMTRQAVALGFVNSLEHRQDQVRAFYQEFLHRAPDPTSAFWVHALRSGVSEETVAEGILNSAEYQRAHQDPALFIHDLYIDVLGRQGDPTGVAGWNAALASGLSRQAIEADFVQSEEASHQIVNGFYAAYLHHPAEVGGSDAYVTMLEAPGGSATDVALDILASSEFDQDAVKPRN